VESGAAINRHLVDRIVGRHPAGNQVIKRVGH
jgi:hypothetical protein